MNIEHSGTIESGLSKDKKHTIKETPMRTVKAVAYCECGGELVSKGMCLLGNPPQFVHSCPDCKAEITLPSVHPTILFKPLD